MKYLESAAAELKRYRSLGEKAIAQLSDEDLHWQPNEDSNSIATIVKHISGNMLSRWTEFLTTDGEKTNRNRDEEFVDDIQTRDQLMAVWDRGWQCTLAAIAALTEDDLYKTVTIRAEPHSVVQAINRQICHYAYHVGQIVFIAKQRSTAWKPLTIPKGKSADYLPR